MSSRIETSMPPHAAACPLENALNSTSGLESRTSGPVPTHLDIWKSDKAAGSPLPRNAGSVRGNDLLLSGLNLGWRHTTYP